MSFGWIVGEVVRRITGKPIERFLQEDIFATGILAPLPVWLVENEHMLWPRWQLRYPLAWADATTGCAIAIVTNGNRAPTNC
jgi:hypothetical protein